MQTKLTQYFTKNISQNIGVDITVQKVDIGFWSYLILEGVSITDSKSDTLARVDELWGKIDIFELADSKFIFSNTILKGLDVKILTDSAGNTNIYELTRKLHLNNSSQMSFILNLDEIDVRNSRFIYSDARETKYTRHHLVNIRDVEVTDINFIATDLIFDSTGLMLLLEELSLNEKSGFMIQKLSTQAYINNKNLSFNNIELITANSTIDINYLDFTFDSFSDFPQFIEKINIKSDIDYTFLAFEDISYFVRSLQGFNVLMKVQGEVEGTVADFKARNLKVHYGDSTYFDGDAEVVGLPNIYQTYWYVDVNELQSTITDVLSFPVYPFYKGSSINLPKSVKKIRRFEYEGNFSGFSTDFVTYGSFQTPIGSFSTDLALKTDSLLTDYYARGKLQVDSMDLSQYFNSKLWGYISGRLNVDGNINTNGEFKATVMSDVAALDCKGYTYRNIAIDGELTDKRYNGLMSVFDDNLQAYFDGQFDFTDTIPLFDFSLLVDYAQLYNLNLVTVDSLAVLSTNVYANFTGHSFDNAEGQFMLTSTDISNRYGKFTQDTISVYITNEKHSRLLELTSNAFDLIVEGDFLFNKVAKDFKLFTHSYIPSLFPHLSDTIPYSSKNVSFNFNFKEVDSVFKYLYPELSIANNTIGRGAFIPNQKLFRLDMICDHFYYNNFEMKDINLAVFSQNKTASVEMNYDMPFHERTIEGISTSMTVSDDTLDCVVEWSNIDSLTYEGIIDAELVFFQKDTLSQLPSIRVAFEPGQMIVADSVWSNEKFSILIDTSSIAVQNLLVKGREQNVFVSGSISEDVSDTLICVFDRFNMHNINQYVDSALFNIRGYLNGSVKFTDVYNDFVFHIGITGEGVEINDELMGDIFLFSNWNPVEQNLKLFCNITTEGVQTLGVEGIFIPKTNTIDISSTVNQLEISFLEILLDKVISETEGYGTGNITVSGTIYKPDIRGKMTLSETSFLVNYLNTKYSLQGDVLFENKALSFKNLRVSDRDGNNGAFSGIVDLNNIFNPEYRLVLNADKMLFLDTRPLDNDLYYGTVFGSGIVKISGDLETTSIKIAAKTESNSNIVIPYSDNSVVAENSFVKFVEYNFDDETVTITSDEKIDFQGINLEFDLEVTPEMEVRIIMDDYAGGEINARGQGTIKMEVDQYDDFTMSGEYNIIDGNYLFVLGSVINKKFKISQGSNFVWNGDPLNANVQLEAKYRLKASVKPIIDDTTSNLSSRVPVDCKLYMTNSLLYPDIEFDIEIVEGNDRAQEIIETFDYDEKNRQFFSLLVLNSFVYRETPNNISSSNSNALNVTSWEMLSNQFSGWLSQISNDVDLGVNYRPSDEITGDELEVAISTQLLNDRVIVNVNGATEFSDEDELKEGEANSSKFAGDVSVEVKLNKKGNVRVKGFSRTNNDPYDQTDEITQGFGIFYTEDFDKIGDLFRKRKDNSEKQSQDSTKIEGIKNDENIAPSQD